MGSEMKGKKTCCTAFSRAELTWWQQKSASSVFLLITITTFNWATQVGRAMQKWGCGKKNAVLLFVLGWGREMKPQFFMLAEQANFGEVDHSKLYLSSLASDFQLTQARISTKRVGGGKSCVVSACVATLNI